MFRLFPRRNRKSSCLFLVAGHAQRGSYSCMYQVLLLCVSIRRASLPTAEAIISFTYYALRGGVLERSQHSLLVLSNNPIIYSGTSLVRTKYVLGDRALRILRTVYLDVCREKLGRVSSLVGGIRLIPEKIWHDVHTPAHPRTFIAQHGTCVRATTTAAVNAEKALFQFDLPARADKQRMNGRRGGCFNK